MMPDPPLSTVGGSGMQKEDSAIQSWHLPENLTHDYNSVAFSLNFFVISAELS